MFSHSNNLILGGTFNHHPCVGANGFQLLQEAASPSAFHNSGHTFDQPKCHPNTRVAVMEKIKVWVDRVDGSETSVMWMKGSAGVGKSAIARAMAEFLAANQRLLATYFFSRTDSTRNSVKSVMASIAYQACLYDPELRAFIVAAVENDPLIFTRTLDTQLRCLLTEPIRTLFTSRSLNNSSSPRVIIIDGLDECVDTQGQITIINLIHDAVRNEDLPFLFFLASRPERQISLSFDDDKFADLLTRFSLDESFFAGHDIRFFLEDTFAEIKQAHPMRAYLPPSWPEKSVIDDIVRKSSGQFIYASTVKRFISSRSHRPNDRLDILRRLRPLQNENPFSQLDALYTAILENVNIDHIDSALTIIGFMVCSHLKWSLRDIDLILNFPPGEVELVLGEINSLIEFDLISVKDGYTAKLLHASFIDFVCDKARSDRFYVNPQERNILLATRWLRFLEGPQTEWMRKMTRLIHLEVNARFRGAFNPKIRQEHIVLDISFNLLLDALQTCFLKGVDLGPFLGVTLRLMKAKPQVYSHIMHYQALREMLIRYISKS